MTRLYVPSDTTPGVTVALAAEWDGDYREGTVVATPTPAGASTLAMVGRIESTGVLNADFCLYQVHYPLPTGIAFTTADTVRGIIRAIQGTTASNMRTQCIIRVVDSTGTTVRATLYAGDLSTGSTNPVSEWAQNFNFNRYCPRSSPQALAVNYTSVAGDILIIEFGYRHHSTTTTTTGRMQIGYDSANPDCSFNEADSFLCSPWIEFTTDLTSAPVPPSRRRMTMIS